MSKTGTSIEPAAELDLFGFRRQRIREPWLEGSEVDSVRVALEHCE